MNSYWKCIKSPVGFLKIETNADSLVSVSFVSGFVRESEFQPEILTKACRQLDEYFEGKRKTFSLKLAPAGTPFQKMVWNKIAAIRFGETATYTEIARQVGTIKHTRAVGLANGKNPLPIVIPCHRVIGANGKLTGYAGGLERKKWLLRHEQKHTVQKNSLF